jgi:DNA-directed RNA polymerase specialized sigma24 family protein
LRAPASAERGPEILAPETIDLLTRDAPGLDFKQQRLESLMHCIQMLSPRAQEAIRFRYLSSMKSSEVAERLSLAKESVYVMLARARTALRECVEKRVLAAED